MKPGSKDKKILNFLKKILSHPVWTGIGVLVAIMVAIFTPLLTVPEKQKTVPQPDNKKPKAVLIEKPAMKKIHWDFGW